MATEDVLRQLVIQSLGFVILGAIVYVLTKALRFRYRGWSFADAGRASLWGIVAILVSWVLVSALFFLFASSRDMPQSVPGGRRYSLNDVVNQAVIALLAFGPVLLAMRWRREPWASAGVSAHNLGCSLVVGLVLAFFTVVGIFFGGGRSFSEVAGGLTVSHFWALLKFAIVGFGEEFAFRGYLQTRLMAWLGQWQGWVVTSVLMALAHVVQRMTIIDLSPLEAVISSASLVPISLLMGYVMLRTENVVAPGLFHTFANWVNTLS